MAADLAPHLQALSTVVSSTWGTCAVCEKHYAPGSTIHVTKLRAEPATVRPDGTYTFKPYLVHTGCISGA